MQHTLSADRIYDLMENVGRVYYGHDDHWRELKEIAEKLCHDTTASEPTDILLGGWHLDEERHGGYESSSGYRERLGQGTLLYRGTISKQTPHHPSVKLRDWHVEVYVEAWKQEEVIVFLAFKKLTVSGYVGIDNHHGVDTTWSVIGLRIVRVW
jgi:hypothetical protein